MSNRYLLVLVLAWPGCKAKEKSSPESAPAQVAAEAETPEPAPAPEVSEADEQVIIKDFVTRFTDAIDADDSARWAEVVTKDRAARYAQEGVMDKVYAAWRRGTATVSERIRQAPFRLEKTAEKMTLHFENVIVANDPETGYSMTVRIEDGKMYLDEN